MTQNKGYFLPNWDDLSEEQKKIVNLPNNRNYLIQGSPGTGKTMMALYRASRLATIENDEILVLVYNRPLMQYMVGLTRNLNTFRNVTINTYHSWILDFYRRNFRGSPVPKVEGEGNYNYDWKQIKEDFMGMPKSIGHIVIDEAQDFPIELIEALTMVAEKITCFVDPNQAIEANKTHNVEMLKKICFEPEESLTKNFRNTLQIAKLSEKFWGGKGHPLAVPNEKKMGDKPHVIRCSDYDDQTEKIVRIIRNNEGATIGVLAAFNSVNNTYRNLVNELEGEVDIEMYKSLTKNNHLDFTKPGVKVLSYGTMKGLEFDMVILTRFDAMDRCKDRETGEFDIEADRNRAFVAITRPREHLYITYFREQCGARWADVTAPLFKNRDLVVLE